MKKILLSLSVIGLLTANNASAQCDITGTTNGSTCKGQTGIISAAPSPGGSVLWYAQSSGGTHIDTGNILTIPSATTTTTYYAEGVSGGVTTPDSINTLAMNNGQVSAMFDCKPLNDITVTGINFVPRSSGSYTVSVYYKTGTFVGDELNSNAWTLLGTSSSFSVTANALTSVPLTLSQSLTANQTYAFYIHANSGGSLGYTNGTSVGSQAVANSDIIIYQGKGGAGLFSSSVFSPRTFSGTLKYEIGSSCTSSTRTPVVLTVHPELKIDTQTNADTTCASSRTALFVKPNGPVNTYKWQIWNGTLNAFVDISGPPFQNNGDSLVITSTNDTLDGARIRVVLDGCGIDTSAEMILAVNAIPTVSSHPPDVTANQGDNVSFSVKANGKNISYQWQVGVKDTFANINNGGIYSGVKTNTLTVKGVSHAQNEFKFRCIVSSGYCTADPDTSNDGVLYVAPAASVTNLNSNDGITLYPNPVNGNEITLVAATNISVNEYYLIDNLGRSIAKRKIQGNKAIINVGSLPTGTYTIKLKGDDKVPFKPLRFTKL